MSRTITRRAARVALVAAAALAVGAGTAGRPAFASAPTSGATYGLPFASSLIHFSTIEWSTVNWLGIPVAGASYQVSSPARADLTVVDNGARDLDDRPGRLRFASLSQQNTQFQVCPGAAPAGYYFRPLESCRGATVGQGQTEGIADFMAISLKTIKWQVRDQGGDLIGGAKFRLERPGTLSDLQIGGDADGRYAVVDQRAGDYKLCMVTAPPAHIGSGCKTFSVPVAGAKYEVSPAFTASLLVQPVPTQEPEPDPTDEPDDPPAPPAPTPKATPAPAPTSAPPAGGNGPAPSAGASDEAPTSEPTAAAPSSAAPSGPAATDGSIAGAGGAGTTETGQGGAGEPGLGIAVIGGGVALLLLVLVAGAVIRRRLVSRRATASPAA